MSVGAEGFREQTAGVEPRAALPAPEQLRGLPHGPGRLDPGEIPTLQDLGLTPLPPASSGSPGSSDVGAGGSAGAGSSGWEAAAPVGGESEALRRLRTFMATVGGSISSRSGCGGSAGSSSSSSSAGGGAYASNFASTVAPWLATGCLSPRLMMEQARSRLAPAAPPAAAASQAAAAAGAGSGAAASGGGGQGAGGALPWVNWELLWRDYFRWVRCDGTQE